MTIESPFVDLGAEDRRTRLPLTVTAEPNRGPGRGNAAHTGKHVRGRRFWLAGLIRCPEFCAGANISAQLPGTLATQT